MTFSEIAKDTFATFLSFIINEFMKTKHQNDLIVKIKSTVASDCETEKEEEELQKRLNPILKDLYKKLCRNKLDVQEILDDFNKQAKLLLQGKYNSSDCDKLCHQFDEIIIDYFKRFYPDKFQTFKLEKIDDTLNKDIGVLLKEYNGVYDYEGYQQLLRNRISKDGVTIGLDFFKNDDMDFKEKFLASLTKKTVVVYHIDRKEAIGCVMNLLHEEKIQRPFFVVENKKTWDKLRSDNTIQNAIYLAGFYDTGEIINVPDSTCIYFTDNYRDGLLVLRKRTLQTIRDALIASGCSYDLARRVIKETNGLFSSIRYRFLNGHEEQFYPEGKIPDRMIPAILLSNGWERKKGDDEKFICDHFGLKYGSFCSDLKPYTGRKLVLLRKTFDYEEYYVTNMPAAWHQFGRMIDSDMLVSFLGDFSKLLVNMDGKYQCSVYFLDRVLFAMDYVVNQYRKDWQTYFDDFVKEVMDLAIKDGLMFYEVLSGFGLILIDISPSAYFYGLKNHKEEIKEYCECAYGDSLYCLVSGCLERTIGYQKYRSPNFSSVLDYLFEMTEWKNYTRNKKNR